MSQLNTLAATPQGRLSSTTPPLRLGGLSPTTPRGILSHYSSRDSPSLRVGGFSPTKHREFLLHYASRDSPPLRHEESPTKKI